MFRAISADDMHVRSMTGTLLLTLCLVASEFTGHSSLARGNSGLWLLVCGIVHVHSYGRLRTYLHRRYHTLTSACLPPRKPCPVQAARCSRRCILCVNKLFVGQVCARRTGGQCLGVQRALAEFQLIPFLRATGPTASRLASGLSWKLPSKGTDVSVCHGIHKCAGPQRASYTRMC